MVVWPSKIQKTMLKYSLSLDTPQPHILIQNLARLWVHTRTRKCCTWAQMKLDLYFSRWLFASLRPHLHLFSSCQDRVRTAEGVQASVHSLCFTVFTMLHPHWGPSDPYVNIFQAWPCQKIIWGEITGTFSPEERSACVWLPRQAALSDLLALLSNGAADRTTVCGFTVSAQQET